MSDEPRFDFYEKVLIRANGKPVDGLLGAILARGRNANGGWGYGVHVYVTCESWDLDEDELEPTGEFDVRETFYDGSSICVSVDDEGRGHIVGENIDHDTGGAEGEKAKQSSRGE